MPQSCRCPLACSLLLPPYCAPQHSCALRAPFCLQQHMCCVPATAEDHSPVPRPALPQATSPHPSPPAPTCCGGASFRAPLTTAATACALLLAT